MEMFVGNFKMNSRDIKEKNKKRDCEQSKVGSKRKKEKSDNKDINLSIKKIIIKDSPQKGYLSCEE